jgi:transposase
MKQKKEFLPQWSVKELKRMYKGEKDQKVKMRILCAIHRKSGDTLFEITEKTQISKSTIHDHLKRFKQGSKEALFDKKRPGKPPKLSLAQRKRLDSVLLRNPKEFGYEVDVWSTKLIMNYVKKEFKKSYTFYGMCKLLRSIKYSLQKQRPIHHKGDEKEQKRFKKNLNVQPKSLKNTDIKSCFWTKVQS